MCDWQEVLGAWKKYEEVYHRRHAFFERNWQHERDMSNKAFRTKTGRKKRLTEEKRAILQAEITVFIQPALRALRRLDQIKEHYEEVLRQRIEVLDLSTVPRTEGIDTEVAKHRDIDERPMYSTTRCHTAARERARVTEYEVKALGFRSRVEEGDWGIAVLADIDVPRGLAVRLLGRVTLYETLVWIWDNMPTVNVKAMFSCPWLPNWGDDRRQTAKIREIVAERKHA